MKQYANPFLTTEAMKNALDSLGADPLQLGATNTGETATWPEKILSINVDKVYSGGPYYKVYIQLNNEGFDEIIGLIGLGRVAPILVKPLSTDYNQYSIEPSPLLTILTLKSKEQEQEQEVTNE